LAGLIGLGDFRHLVHKAGGTAGDGSGDGVLRQAADDDGSLGRSSFHGGNQVGMLAELLGGDGGSGLVVGGGGGLHGAGGIIGNTGVEADDGNVLLSAFSQDFLHGVGGQSSQSHGLGVLGHLVLDHVDLRVDLGLGSGAVEV